MNHTRDTHIDAVDSLCRICGQLKYTKKQLKNYTKPKLCQSISNDIFCVGDLRLQDDLVDKHSKFICTKCYLLIFAAKKRESNTTKLKIRSLILNSSNIWCEFSNVSLDNCSVCRHRQQLTHGCINLQPKAVPPSENELINTHQPSIDLQDTNNATQLQIKTTNVDKQCISHSIDE